jgi:Cft2 family RNA processing exonuclease
MTDIKVTPLGAGQDVGRSCILLQMGGKNIMLDCGMHMGYNDEVSKVLVVQMNKFCLSFLLIQIIYSVATVS